MASNTTNKITVFAPAKINLFLHVTGKREDGYHLLQSLITFADIGDEITITPSDNLKFTSDGDFDVDAEDNLVIQAAHKIADKLGHSLDCHIHLTKNIPLGAGLGGGSADAAAVIKGLLEYWETFIPLEKIQDLLLELGADVPVCYHGQLSFVEEIGENLEELRADSVRIAKDMEFMKNWVRNRVEGNDSQGFEANFRLSILSRAAYDVAKVNQSLTHLSNEQNMDIAGIYALQDFYTLKASEVFGIMGDLQGDVLDQNTDEFFKLVQKMRYHEGLVFNTIRAYISGGEEFLERYPQANE